MRTTIPRFPIKALCLCSVSTSKLRLEIALGPAPNSPDFSLSTVAAIFILQSQPTSRQKNNPGSGYFPTHPCYQCEVTEGYRVALEAVQCSTYRSEGLEDFFQDFMESLLAAGRDVILCQLQEGQAVLALAPHVLRPRRVRRKQRTQVTTLEF